MTVWYAQHGHAPDDVTGHRAQARWYTTKTEPSYDDMAIKLRRVIIANRFRGPCPEQVTPQETQAVLAAWAAAGTGLWIKRCFRPDTPGRDPAGWAL